MSEFRQRLEDHNNPDEVRQRLAAGNYRSPNDKIAQEYLDSIDRKESAKAASLRDAREEETLSIAKAAAASASDANTIARSNSRRIWRSEIIAAIAAIAAIVAAIAAIKGIK